MAQKTIFLTSLFPDSIPILFSQEIQTLRKKEAFSNVSIEAILLKVLKDIFFISATTLTWLIEDSQTEAPLMVYSMSYFEYFYVHTLPDTDKVALPSEFGREKCAFRISKWIQLGTTDNMQNI